MRKIALEEHFITPDLLQNTQKVDFAAMNQEDAIDFQNRLLDFDNMRIKNMDEADIEISVLSLTDPGIKIILGHLGETLPYLLWRLDSRWGIVKHPKKLKKLPSQYIKENFYVTTSGMCSNGPLMCAIQELGEDRVMFSVDYPYESSKVAAQFIEQINVDIVLLEKICYKNAQKILKI